VKSEQDEDARIVFEEGQLERFDQVRVPCIDVDVSPRQSFFVGVL
jgi:hypothetical protein